MRYEDVVCGAYADAMFSTRSEAVLLIHATLQSSEAMLQCC